MGTIAVSAEILDNRKTRDSEIDVYINLDIEMIYNRMLYKIKHFDVYSE